MRPVVRDEKTDVRSIVSHNTIVEQGKSLIERILFIWENKRTDSWKWKCVDSHLSHQCILMLLILLITRVGPTSYEAFISKYYSNTSAFQLRDMTIKYPSHCSRYHPLSVTQNILTYDDVNHICIYLFSVWQWPLSLTWFSISPSAAYMRQWIGSALVQIMATGAKPFPKPVLWYC